MKLIAGIFKFFAYCFLGLIIFAVFGAIVGGGSGSSSHTSQSAQSTPVAAAALAGEATNSVAQEEPEPAEPEPNWRYGQKKDEMRDKTDFYARTTSKNTIYLEFPYAGGTQLSITLRKSAKFGEDVYLSVNKGQFHCGVYDCKVRAKFDDGAIQTFGAVEPEQGGNDTLFIHAARNFAYNLKKSQRLTLEVDFYDRGWEQFTFDVSGLEWEHFGNAAPKRKRRR